MYMYVLSCMCDLENFTEGFKCVETNKQMFLRSRDNFENFILKARKQSNFERAVLRQYDW